MRDRIQMKPETDEPLLGERYRYTTGESVRGLNDEQQAIRDQVQEKLDTGDYRLESFPCTVCDSTAFVTLSEKERYGLNLPIEICRDCGLIQGNPRFDRETASEFYRHEYRRLYGLSDDESVRFEEQYQRGEPIFAYLSENIPKRVADCNVVEIGCGYGGLLAYFDEQGATVLGCDLDEQAIDFAQSKGLPARAGDVRDLDLPWNPDVVILDDVLEHLVEPAEVIEYMTDTFPEDTYIYIEMPGVKHLHPTEGPYSGDFLEYAHVAHTHHFSQRTLRTLLQCHSCETVAANESIQALFRNSGTEGTADITSDYSEAISHLQFLERYYNPVYRYLRFPHHHPKFTKALRKTGVYPHVKRMYERFSRANS